jgi:hypothetical protein
MWRDTLQALTTDIAFYPPAPAAEIVETERILAITLPDDLRALLAESNGVTGEYGVALIWTAQEIRAQNIAFRMNDDFAAIFDPFDDLLFFADAGNGDQFAYHIVGGRITDPSIYEWNHEEDTREIVAPSLLDYLKGAITHTLYG